MKASVATATRYGSVACDERNFSSSEERALVPLGLSAPRSATCSLKPLTVASTCGSEGKRHEAQLTSSLTLALRKLMECKAPDGRYLMTRKVHWQAVYRVLVDEGWYDASLGYAAFVEYIRSATPPGGFRIMPDVETIRHISQSSMPDPSPNGATMPPTTPSAGHTSG